MRYLGVVAEKFKDKEYNHIKILLERECIFRCAKHLINEQMRESSNTYLGAVVAHLLNLLLAPLPFIE
jgi:hypothetical protein